MTEFRGILELQVNALLTSLHAQKERRCLEIVREAEQHAKELIRTSRHELRKRRRQAVAEERQRRQATLSQAQNRIRSAASQRMQKLYARVLQAAWPELEAELERRWSGARERRAWCALLLDEAVQTLRPQPWRIEHPADLSGADAKWLASVVAERGLPAASLGRDDGLTAGLRIREGAASVDGSLAGLLARRETIEGMLLAAFEAELAIAADDADG